MRVIRPKYIIALVEHAYKRSSVMNFYEQTKNLILRLFAISSKQSFIICFSFFDSLYIGIIHNNEQLNVYK